MRLLCAAPASHPKRRIVVQDPSLKSLELWRGLEPELVEGSLRRAVRVERVGLPSRAVERAHVLGAESFPERVLGNKDLKLSDERSVLAEGEASLDLLLGRDDAQLLQPLDRRAF